MSDRVSTSAHLPSHYLPYWRGILALSAVLIWMSPRADRYFQPSKDLVFAPPSAVEAGNQPVFHSYFADSGMPVGIAHSPSLCELPDGRMAAVWYAGSREGARDVGISLAEFDPHAEPSWSDPRVIMDVSRATRDLGRWVRKVGNPVIFSDHAGTVSLAYVSVSVGGWSASSLNVTKSTDQLVSWNRSRRLSLSPVGNISELVRCPPITMASGEVVLPIYHEFIGKFPQLLWLSHQGAGMTWSKTRMAGGRQFLQPTVVPLSSHYAVAYYRNAEHGGPLTMAESHDAGRSWGPTQELDLPNNDSSVSALRLTDGSVLLAFNDDSRGRSNLKLAVSRDGRQNWKRLATLDEEQGEKFAYPYMIRASDGMIHLVYSWKMQRIRHVVFNEAWLAELQQDRSKEVSQ
jgi:predicted neuraminidase